MGPYTPVGAPFPPPEDLEEHELTMMAMMTARGVDVSPEVQCLSH